MHQRGQCLKSQKVGLKRGYTTSNNCHISIQQTSMEDLGVARLPSIISCKIIYPHETMGSN